jgi:hypothetical protein
MAIIKFEGNEIAQISGYTFEQQPKVGDELTTWEGREIVQSVVTGILHQQLEGHFALVVVCKVLGRSGV